MVPSGVGVLDGLPLTPVGKLDTAALPAPVLAAVGEFVEPATDVERTVAQVFAQVLVWSGSVPPIRSSIWAATR